MTEKDDDALGQEASDMKSFARLAREYLDLWEKQGAFHAAVEHPVLEPVTADTKGDGSS